MQPCAGGGGPEGRHPLGQQRADDPGQHVAGAGRRQAGVAGVDEQDGARRGRRRPWSEPFSSTTQPELGGQPRAAAMRSAPAAARRHSSRYSPSCGVSTVGAGRARSTAPAPSATTPARRGRRRRRRPEAAALATTLASTGGGGCRRRPSPGPMTRAWKRSRSSSTVRRPAVGRQRPTDHLGGRQRVVADTGRRQPHVAGAGPLRAARTTRWAAPSMPADPATTHTRGPPLVGVGRPTRQPRRDVVRSTRCAVAATCRGRCRRPRRRRPARVPGGEQEAGLEGGERDGAGSPARTPGPAAPVSPSTPLGMSTASTGAPPGVGRRPRAAEAGAVGGVDDEVGRRQRRRARRRRRSR